MLDESSLPKLRAVAEEDLEDPIHKNCALVTIKLIDHVSQIDKARSKSEKLLMGLKYITDSFATSSAPEIEKVCQALEAMAKKDDNRFFNDVAKVARRVFEILNGKEVISGELLDLRVRKGAGL